MMVARVIFFGQFFVHLEAHEMYEMLFEY